MIFSRQTVKIGGRITVPDSFVCQGEGFITGMTNDGINVCYYSNETIQRAFYAFIWLNQMYGEKFDWTKGDDIPEAF